MNELTRTTTGPSFSGIAARIEALFEAVARANWRTREMERLSAMSDAQLAAEGLRREDIARHLFGHMGV